MNSQVVKEHAVRKYLLGVLHEPELDEIEEELLASEKLGEVAEVVEDDIIEQYLDGKLDEPEKKAFETHFLRPPEHREKLRFARLLRHYRENNPSPSIPAPVTGTIHALRSTWAYGTATVAVLLGILSIYLGVAHVSLQRKLKEIMKEQEVLQARLAGEQARNVHPSSMASVQLRPGVTRGSGSAVPKVTVGSATLLVHIDVVLPAATLGSFTARLKNDSENSETIWSQAGLSSVSSPPVATLQLDIPTRGIKPGSYNLAVALQNHAGQIVYPFDIEAGSF